MAGEDESTPSDLDTWERLLHEQTTLFKQTSSRNAELEARVQELETELSVWKSAFKKSDEEKKFLSKTASQLQRSIDSLKDDNPLNVCLIDGDGNIFSPDLIAQGHSGGKQAAMLLTKGLTEHIISDSSADSPSTRGSLWLTVYCNKSGLLETLTNNNLCTTEEFESFIHGFNQASPLFSFVDVGSGKERADEKIKEHLRVFTRFPQTSKVFFGGAHDNGYISTLNYLQNEGLLNKLTILQGYKDLAFELKNLQLPCVEIKDLFLTRKLPASNFNKKQPLPPSASNIASPSTQFQEFMEKYRAQYTISSPPKPSSTMLPAGERRYPDDSVPLYKLRPPACNFHYLMECKHGDKCTYAHNYILEPRHIEELRDNAKKWPCPYINKGHPCPYGTSCCMAHVCPRGRRCAFLKQKKCKFVAYGMHDHDAVSRGKFRANGIPQTSSQHSRSSSVVPSDRQPDSGGESQISPSSSAILGY